MLFEPDGRCRAVEQRDLTQHYPQPAGWSTMPTRSGTAR
jgi:hypothetical protein